MNNTLYTYTETPVKQNTKELIEQYCTTIDQRIIVLLGIVALMWLIQPKVYDYIDNIKYNNRFVKELFGGNNLKVMYKWLGLGLLFMAGYIIMVMS